MDTTAETLPLKSRIYKIRLSLMDQVTRIAKDKKVTQEQIGERSEMERTNVNRILGGKYSPSLDNFLKICDSLDLAVTLTDRQHKDVLSDLVDKYADSKPNLKAGIIQDMQKSHGK